ncbi:hypothetical protein DFH06DRAFT_971681, partial [Mycena polygramma]
FVRRYHNHTVRTKLTRNIARELVDEIGLAFDDVVALDSADGKPIAVLPTIIQVVARISNQIFVGVPLCANREYLTMCIAYAGALLKSSHVIALVPNLLKPILGPFLSPKEKALRHAMKFLGPLMDERLVKEAELDLNWADKPVGFLSSSLSYIPRLNRNLGPFPLEAARRFI